MADDGLKISQMGLVNPSDNDEIPVRRDDTNKKYTSGGFKTWILAAVNSLLGNYAASSHTHAGVYEPANSNIQNHISDSTIHVTPTNKSDWDAKSSKITKIDLGTKSSNFSVSLAVDSIQLVTISADLTINVDAMPLANGTDTLLIITASGDRVITWDASIPATAFVTRKLTKINGGEKYHVYLRSYNNSKDYVSIECPKSNGVANVVEIDSVDLDEFLFELNHNHGTSNIIATLYDNLGVKVDLSSILTIVDDNNLSIQFGGEITGTYRLIYIYF